MAADLTRDDLAELIALTAEANALQPGTQEHYSAMRRLDRAWGTLRDDRREGILALAIEALDRRDGLVFGPQFDGANHVVAVDGCRYTVWAMDGQYRVFVYASMHGKLVGSFATEAEAIDAARAHDKARRGGK